MKFALDPRSTEFAWTDVPGGRGLTEVERRAFNEDGGFVRQAVFSEAELAPVIQALDELEARATGALEDQPERRRGIARADDIVFSPHLVAEDVRLNQFVRHPALLDLARCLIGPDVRLYWDQLVYKKPHTQDDFPWHQDNGYTFVEPQQYLTCWIALTDATTDNGCPWIVPGLHRKGTLSHRWTDIGFECFEVPPDPGEVRALPLRAGSIAVFSSLTPHRTGPNLTADSRKAYIVQYAPEGAVMHPRPGQGQATAANQPDWQFSVLADGRPV